MGAKDYTHQCTGVSAFGELVRGEYRQGFLNGGCRLWNIIDKHGHLSPAFSFFDLK